MPFGIVESTWIAEARPSGASFASKRQLVRLASLPSTASRRRGSPRNSPSSPRRGAVQQCEHRPSGCRSQSAVAEVGAAPLMRTRPRTTAIR